MGIKKRERMKNMEKMENKQELQAYSKRRGINGYMRSREYLRKIFGKMSLPDFMMLQSIFVLAEESDFEDKRIYMKKLAESMRLTIPEMSKVVTLLQDKGYILWKHDADGHEGTYIVVSESGIRLFREQKQILKQYLESVVKEYGKENTEEFMIMFHKFEEIAVGKAAFLDSERETESGKNALDTENDIKLAAKLHAEVDNDLQEQMETQLNEEFCLIMDAQELVAEVSLDLKELIKTNQLKDWEIKLLETETDSLKKMLEDLNFESISAEEIQKIKWKKEQIERDAEKYYKG